MKILHIVETLKNGAVDNWVYNTYLHAKKKEPTWQWTFFCISPTSNNNDKFIYPEDKIVNSKFSISSKIAFLRELRKLIRTNNFDVIHAHHDYLSGFYLLSTFGLSLKKKIILHSHNNERQAPVANNLIKSIFLFSTRLIALKMSGLIMANSVATLKDFLRNQNKVNKKVLYYGLDFDKFPIVKNRNWLKEEISIDVDAKILLFVGRLYGNKNPSYCVNLLAEFRRRNENVHLVFAGSGEDENVIIEKAKKLNCIQNIHMLGFRTDIYAIMQGSDLLLFPRLEYPKEGFGLNVIEAQACALPSLVSYGVENDVVIIEGMVTFKSLKENESKWVDEMVAIVNKPKKEVTETLKALKNSKVDIDYCTHEIIMLYKSIASKN